MTFFDSVKGTVCTAVDTIANVTQEVVERNRTNAKLNRLRLIMKNESELMNRAYIALGKSYYDANKKGETIPTEQQTKLFEVIENSKNKIAKARECYRKIVDSTNDIYYGTPETPIEYKKEDIVDITVACSNENEYNTETEIATTNVSQKDFSDIADIADGENIDNVDNLDEVRAIDGVDEDDKEILENTFQPKHAKIEEENTSTDIYSSKKSEIEQLKVRLSALDIDTDEDELF